MVLRCWTRSMRAHCAALLVGACIGSRLVSCSVPPAPDTAFPALFMRPNLYFGTTTQEPHPLLTGLAWMPATEPFNHLRHSCQESHKLRRWGWTAHEVGKSGVEFIGDRAADVNMTIAWERLSDASLRALLPAEVRDVRRPPTCTGWTAHLNASKYSAGSARRSSQRAGTSPDSAISIMLYVASANHTFVDLSDPATDVKDAPRRTVFIGRPRADAAAGKMPVAFMVDTPHGGVRSLKAQTHKLHDTADDRDDAETQALLKSGSFNTAGPHVSGHHQRADELWKVEDLITRDVRDSLVTTSRAIQAAQAGRQQARGPRLVDWPPVAVFGDEADVASTLMMVQYVLKPPFSLQWTLLHGDCLATMLPVAPYSVPQGETAPTETELDARMTALRELAALAAPYDAHAAPRIQAQFDATMCSSFGLCGSANDTRQHVVTAAAANLLGSVTYFHGEELLGKASTAADAHWYTVSEPHGLFTGVPSRAFFPRGFLWDEGFHQLILSQMHPQLSLAAVTSWLGTMTSSGWIPREQILGAEARARVPQQFQIQRPDIANPPTLLFPIMALLEQGVCTHAAQRELREEAGRGDVEDAASAVVVEVNLAATGALEGPAVDEAEMATQPPSGAWPAPRIAAFCAAGTSAGATDGEVAGALRTALPPSAAVHANELGAPPVAHNTSSGLTQDMVASLPWLYARMQRHFQWFLTTQRGAAPHSFRWRGATRGHNFASGFDDLPRGVLPTANDEAVDLLAWMTFFARSLSRLALLVGTPAEYEQYRATADTYAKRLVERHWNEERGIFCDIGAVSETPVGGQPPRGGGKVVMGHVCHTSYVSILPLALALLPADAPQLPRLLRAIRTELWSPYGLRSLAPTSPLYGTEEDYWRSAVWLNVNYLTAGALAHYSHTAQDAGVREDARTAAEELRTILLNTVITEYERTGFIWENYNDKSGAGRGTHPFTGWSSLVILLAARRFPHLPVLHT